MANQPERPPRVPVRRMLAELERLYPDVRTALRFDTPFQLLVATMLSAQCTDVTVNRVTPGLFGRWPRAADLAVCDPVEVGEAIRLCGLWRTKARNIVAASRQLCERHGGEVPPDFESLVALPGVGRKTANVVLANAFGVPALAVDTHVLRVANRLGLARAKTPEETERQLRRRIPRRLWAPAHHWLIWHGRRVCIARQPRCSACTLQADCPTGRARLPRPTRTRTRGGGGANAGGSASGGSVPGGAVSSGTAASIAAAPRGSDPVDAAPVGAPGRPHPREGA